MTRTFLDRIMSGYEPDARMTWEIRAIDRQTREVSQYWFGPGYAEVASDDCASLADTHDVYVGVLPRSGRRGYAQDVLSAAWLYSDIDTDGTSEGILAANELIAQAPIPEPTMRVNSGGGVHAYWKLAQQFPVSTSRAFYTNILKRLVRTIGGEKGGIAYADPAATDCSRVLRVPGTFNHKYNPARRVTFWTQEVKPLTLEEWDRMLRPLPVRVMTQYKPSGNVTNDNARDIIDRACASRRGDEFRRLYVGDLSHYGGDESRADMALLGLLRFFTHGNERLMLDVFALSALGQRDKWRDREDYRKRTMDRVMGRA